MSLDQKAQILEAIASATCGVRDIVQMLTCKTLRVVSLLKEMEAEGLIVFHHAERSKRGRPKKIITCTSLGFEFIEAYKKVRIKPLRARRVDLERAVKDALYAERLVVAGHDAFKLFMELNVVARNIEKSSKASGNTGRA